jgi:DNA-binding IclR family transcriptional regulator
MRPGSVMSMLGTATGQVFAAFMQPKLVDKMIERELPDAAVIAQVKAPMPKKDLDAKLSEVRVRGLARVQSSPIPGISALSAPVFNHTHSIVLVITATGPTGSFNSDWESPIATELKAAADHLSRVLGYYP